MRSRSIFDLHSNLNLRNARCVSVVALAPLLLLAACGSGSPAPTPVQSRAGVVTQAMDIAGDFSDANGFGDASHGETIRFDDVNGDGMADVCARGAAGLVCRISTGTGWGATISQPGMYSDANGWGQPYYYGTLRFPDLNGDGKSDICARSSSGIDCYLSSGVGFGSGQNGPGFNDSGSWLQPQYYTTIQYPDLNGDGKADICARGAAAVYCAFGIGDGTFSSLYDIGLGLSDAQGWNQPQYYSTLQFGDVDGDGAEDAVARGSAGMNWWPFKNKSVAGSKEGWGAGVAGPAWSDVNGFAFPRYYATIKLADIDGDKKADLCGRWSQGYTCYTSSKSTWDTGVTGPAALSDGAGWANDLWYPTLQLGDVDGDGKADLCGRSDIGVQCWISQGTSFSATPILLPSFSDANGWGSAIYSSTIQLADVNGDGAMDVCGRGPNGATCVVMPTVFKGTPGGAICSSADVVEPSGKCDGPWQYESMTGAENVVLTGSQCPWDVAPANGANDCYYPTGTTTNTQSTAQKGNWEVECIGGNPGPIRMNACTRVRVWVPDPSDVCDAGRANAYLAGEKASYHASYDRPPPNVAHAVGPNPWVDIYINSMYVQSYGWSSDYPPKCNITVANAPVVTQNATTPGMCGSWSTPAVYPDSCIASGNGAPSGFEYSNTGLTRDHLPPGALVPTCLTDDTTPVPSRPSSGDLTAFGAAVNTKLVTLKTNLDALLGTGYPTLSDPTARAGVEKTLVTKIKALFEADGDQITDPKTQDYIVGLYDTYPDVLPSCGTPDVAPDTSQCLDAPNAGQLPTLASDLGKLRGRMRMCARVNSLLTHVPPTLSSTTQTLPLTHVQYACIHAADLIATMGKTLNEPDDGATTYFYPAGAPGSGTGDDAGDAGADPSDAATVLSGSDPNDPCAFKAWRNAYWANVSSPLMSTLETQIDPSNPAVQPVVSQRLQLVDTWYASLRDSLYPAGAAPLDAARFKQMNEMIASFWQGIYRELYPQNNQALPDGDAGVALLTQTLQNTLLQDRNLITWMFTQVQTNDPYSKDTSVNAPLHTQPLLFLLADSLEGIRQRLNDVALYHDFGCTYAGCQGTAETEATFLARFIADLAHKSAPLDPPGTPSIDNDVSAAQTLLGNDGHTLVRPEWTAVFKALVQAHGALESALEDAYGHPAAQYAVDEAALDGDGTITPPDSAKHLATIIQEAAAHRRAYAQTGLLLPAVRNRLNQGISDDKVGAVRQDLTTSVSNLSSQLVLYKQNLAAEVQAEVSVLDGDKHTAADLEQLQEKLTTFMNADSDLNGLRARFQLQDSQFSTSTDAYTKLSQIDPNALVSTQTIGQWNIGGATMNAAGVGAAVEALGEVNAGQVLVLATNGTYTPTCSIRAANAAGGVMLPGSTVPQQLGISAGTTVGPEGFTIGLSNGAYTANANASTNALNVSTSVGAKASVCVGVKASIGPDTFAGSVQSYVDISACATAETTQQGSHSQTGTDSNGTESRATASFASGLRLPNTPFPVAPVGALLLVTTPHKQPSVIRDVRVVQTGSTSLVVGEDLDAYLVVNDAACGAATASQLSVSATLGTHSGDAVKAIGPAITAVVKSIDQQRASIVAQGMMLPDQSAQIRSSALSALSTSQGIDITKYPDTVGKFIGAWIDNEIAQIAIEVEIVTLERQMKTLALESDEIRQDLGVSGAQGQLSAMMPAWYMRNMDGELLRSEIEDLVQVTNAELYPILELRYAKIFPVLAQKQDLSAALTNLVTSPWDAPIEQLGNNALTAANLILGATSALDVTYPPVALDYVLFEFPKPGDPEGNTSLPSTWYRADAARSAQVWTELQTGSHVAEITLVPEDLYRKGGGFSILDCAEEAPVIRDMAITLITIGATTIGVRGGGLPTLVSPLLTFPTAAVLGADGKTFVGGGDLTFDMADTDWLTPKVPLLSDNSISDVLTNQKKFRDATASVGRGLSPFTTFTIDFSGIYDSSTESGTDLQHATNLVVGFWVEYRPVGNDRTLDYIATCR